MVVEGRATTRHARRQINRLGGDFLKIASELIFLLGHAGEVCAGFDARTIGFKRGIDVRF